MTAPVTHYRIPCPSDHIVMVPVRLLGEELICPQCNSRFVADFVASVALDVVLKGPTKSFFPI